MLLLIVPAFIVSCDDPEPDPVVLVPKLSGLYVYGTNTIAELSVDPDAKMARAVLNPDKSGGVENMEDIFAKLMYIGAASTIQFTYVDEDTALNYGVVGGGVITPGTDFSDSDIDADFITGALVVEADAIQVTVGGLYYVYANMNTLSLRIMQVEPQMIGDATEAQWASGTDIPQKSASIDSAVFEITDLTLSGASGYKYRFNNGWEVFNDGSLATYTHLGVESYADAWETRINDIGYFGENIPHHDDGVFTVRLKYDPSDGSWEETKIKTGSVLIDYTLNQIGLFGNAYVTAPLDTANWVSGEDGYEVHAPEVAGDVYTWSWDAVDLIVDREFIFLENGAWGGLQYDWDMLTSVGGKSVDDGDIVDATTLGGEYHNFYVVEAGGYDITLVIDAAEETKTVTIVGTR